MDRLEFAKCVERSQKSLRRFLASLSNGNVAIAEDIAQEAYIKAYLASDKTESIGNFNAWITKIAYNTFLNFVRQQRLSIPLEEIANYESGRGADENFKYENLYQALSALPIKDRSALTLFYLEGYSTKEISEILGINEDNVRQVLSRGRKRLKNLI